MKQNKWLLIFLIVLSSVAFYFMLTKKNSTLKEESRDFTVKDTAAITKIFLADRNGNTITLDRLDAGKWQLNGKDQPKYDILKILMDALYKMEVRSPVAKSAYNNVVKSLASSAIKCEIYLNKESKPFKTIYVGDQTADQLGTFMMLEGSSSPFIMHIPGFNGYLTPRFSTSYAAWQSTKLFSYRPDEIKYLMVNYANAPKQSFLISYDKSIFYVQSPVTNQFIQKVDLVAIENYLAQYTNVYYETSINDKQRDTLSLGESSIRITVKDMENKLKTVDIYPVPLSHRSLAQTDSTGNVLKYDLDRVYGIVTPGNNLITIQKPILNRLLRQFSDFDAEKLKKGK
jgi:hypothetical protein